MALVRFSDALLCIVIEYALVGIVQLTRASFLDVPFVFEGKGSAGDMTLEINAVILRMSKMIMDQLFKFKWSIQMKLLKF